MMYELKKRGDVMNSDKSGHRETCVVMHPGIQVFRFSQGSSFR